MGTATSFIFLLFVLTEHFFIKLNAQVCAFACDFLTNVGSLCVGGGVGVQARGWGPLYCRTTDVASESFTKQ